MKILGLLTFVAVVWCVVGVVGTIAWRHERERRRRIAELNTRRDRAARERGQ